MPSALEYSVSLFVPVFIRLGVYALIFQIRRNRVSPLTVLILACAPLIPGVLGLSGLVNSLAGMALSLWILSKNTKIDIFPAGLLIIAVAEITTWGIMQYVIIPIAF